MVKGGELFLYVEQGGSTGPVGALNAYNYVGDVTNESLIIGPTGSPGINGTNGTNGLKGDTGPAGPAGSSSSSSSSSLQNVKTINSKLSDAYKINIATYESNQNIRTSDLNVKCSSVNANLFNIEYNFGPSIQTKYIGVGKDGAATTGSSINCSNNGTNWTACKSPFDTAGGVCNAVATNGAVWVAVGTDTNSNSVTSTRTIVYSFNGTNWSPANGKTFNGVFLG